MPNTAQYRFEVFADYRHFVVQDEQAAVTADEAAGAWTEEALANRLASGRGFVFVETARPMTVPVEVKLEASEPALDLAAYDHAVEASVEFPSGNLVVGGPTDWWVSGEQIVVEPGSYRVRALFTSLDSLSDDGLDGDDAYAIVMWPAPPSPTKVLKRHPAS